MGRKKQQAFLSFDLYVQFAPAFFELLPAEDLEEIELAISRLKPTGDRRHASLNHYASQDCPGCRDELIAMVTLNRMKRLSTLGVQR
jgi:hypothetical protein